MGKALEVITGFVTAPGAVQTVLTMATGNSATVRNASLQSQVGMLAHWATNNAAGIWRIRSPKLHDNVQGIRERVTALNPVNFVPAGDWQRLVPQDNLTLDLSGSAVGGQIEQASLLLYYSDLPGANSRLIGPQELRQRTVNIWTTEVPIAPGAAGGYSGQVAINSTFDQFKANTDYALVGYYVNAQCCTVRFTSPDFANLGVGGPGDNVNRHITGRWFEYLSECLSLPMIPVFNAANKFGTLVDVAQNQAAAAVVVTAVLYELTMPGGSSVAQPMLT